MTDYSFMKSGFDMTVNNEEEEKRNIVSLVTYFGENAIRTSFIYVKHGKRNGVTVEDIKRCTMLEVFFFMKRPNLLEKTKEIKEKIYMSFDSDEEEENNGNIIVNDGEIEDFKESACDCALCKAINTIYARWEKWEPTNSFEDILKKNLDTFGENQ